MAPKLSAPLWAGRELVDRIARRSPARLALMTFAGVIAVFTALLNLPAATSTGVRAPFVDAFFTATSAVCVTGLVTVPTGTYWSVFGQAVILAGIQVGGLGVMTLASILGAAVSRRIGLTQRLLTASETKTTRLGEVGSLIRVVVITSLTLESVIAALLLPRFLALHETFREALWHAVFYAVSAFNNAGFALYSANLMDFVGDAWICLPIAFATIIGGLGFPVIRQLRRYGFDLMRWSMNTRLVLVLTPLLLVAGWAYIGILEWRNPGTLGPLAWDDKLLAAFFQSVQTRTSGFNSVDIGAMHETTWLGMDILMFIGTGPAGTGGGIKLTTFAVLFFIIWAEVRGDTAVHIFGKRLSRAVHRQAISVALLAVALVVGCTGVIMVLSPFGLDRVLFEAVSAFGTVGLSTGITAKLDPASQLVLCFLMYVGRLGPITFASALALSQRKRLYELPKERPIIG